MKKFFSIIAMIAAVAVMGVSCDPPQPTPEPTPETLTANVTPSEITADGESKAVFTVKYGDKAVSNVKAYVNGVETALNNLTFTTKTAGTYKFYFSYEWTTGKTVKSNEVSVTANEPEEKLTITANNTILQVNKDLAIFTIKYNGKIIESNYKIYVNDKDTKLPTTDVTINGKTYKQPYFKSSQTGSFTFWVSYNITENTKKQLITIKVINDAIPARAEDPNPSSTSFKKRAMVMQFTGTACGYCPLMIDALEQVSANSTYKDLFTWAAIHTFNNDDLARPSNTLDYNLIPNLYGYNSFPYVVVDMNNGIVNDDVKKNIENIKKAIDNSLSSAASVGISATMTLDEANRVLTVRATVKANMSQNYRIGMWVLENNIKAGQYTNYDEYNITKHDHAVRYAESRNKVSDYSGYDLGRISKGQTVDYIFSVDIQDQSIKLANCQLLFFATTELTSGKWAVVNSAVTKDLKTTLPFEYNN